MSQASNLKSEINGLPNSSGVYLFKDSDNSILYIGKANNLKKRARSYLKPNHESHKTTIMVSLAESIEYRVTKNELEAMLLEAQLIETHQPPFNILLKSGRPFLYFFFSRGKLPRMELKRGRLKTSQGTSIGPFTSSTRARALLDSTEKRFRLKICNKQIPGGCLYFHLGICAGYCLSKTSEENKFDLADYKERLELAKKHIKKTLGSRSTASGLSSLDQEHSHGSDIWIQKNSLHLFHSENGLVKKKRTFILENTAESKDYLLSYYRTFPCPRSVFLNFELENQKTIQDFISKWQDAMSTISVIDTISQTPPDVVALAIAMAKAEEKSSKNSATALQFFFKTPKPIVSVDCFDVSHTQGQNLVGSCIRFTNGKPTPNLFRKFKLKRIEDKTAQANDDYASLKEIVRRRYKDEKEVPDLVLIDGGKGQLNAVKNLFPELLFSSLAKKEERVFAPGFSSNGKKLNFETIEGALLISLRDYAHHFAISYQRKLASIISSS